MGASAPDTTGAFFVPDPAGCLKPAPASLGAGRRATLVDVVYQVHNIC